MPYRNGIAVLVAVFAVLLPTADSLAVLHPRLGRFTQRDPSGTAVAPRPVQPFIPRDLAGQTHGQYPDGMNLYSGYQVIRGGLDPSGLAVEAIAIAGINNGGRNYVRNWMKTIIPGTIHDIKSDLALGDLLLSSEEKLDKEAADKAPELGKICGNDPSLHILMLAPKTATPPPANTQCKLNITVLWNPLDPTPNQGLFGAKESQQFWQQWGGNQTYAVRPRDPSGHAWVDGHLIPPDYNDPLVELNQSPVRVSAGPRHGPRSRPRREIGIWGPTGRMFNSADMITAMHASAQDGEYVVVCHSQGCNILMAGLNAVCTAGKKATR